MAFEPRAGRFDASPAEWTAFAIAVALSVGGWLASGSDPSGFAVRCVFHDATGMPCPTCGSTRALLALWRGDLLTALRYNPVGSLVAAVFAAFAVYLPGSLLWRRRLVLAARLRWIIFGVTFSALFIVWGLRLAGLLPPL
ncbi:MAG: DUF2752 domain-containing protein [Planctomycetota bacterium]